MSNHKLTQIAAMCLAIMSPQFASAHQFYAVSDQGETKTIVEQPQPASLATQKTIGAPVANLQALPALA